MLYHSRWLSAKKMAGMLPAGRLLFPEIDCDVVWLHEPNDFKAVLSFTQAFQKEADSTYSW